MSKLNIVENSTCGHRFLQHGSLPLFKVKYPNPTQNILLKDIFHDTCSTHDSFRITSSLEETGSSRMTKLQHPLAQTQVLPWFIITTD